MDITIISTRSENSLETTKYFGIILSKTLTLIHMVHWYIGNLQIHEVLGDLYGDLDDLFDKLQEEIIGTARLQDKLFPGFSPEMVNIDDVAQFSGDDENLMDSYYKTIVKLTAILNSLEFKNYIESVDSGLNNTKEDVLSRVNKANYLLSMIQL
jgi:hypothetical protein